MEWQPIETAPKDGTEIILLASKKSDYNYKGDMKHFQNKQFIGSITHHRDDPDIVCVFGDGWVPFSFDELVAWMPLPNPPKES